MDILKDLYFGRIQPSERSIREGGEYEKLDREATAAEEAFRCELSKEGKQIYDAFRQKEGDLIEAADCDSFIKGFRLGMKLLLAVLMEYDSPLPQVEI